MEPLLLVLLVAVFILPSFLMMRSQRRRQNELQTMQASIGNGERVVTVAGIHGTVVRSTETQVDLEIAPGVQVTMDRIAIMRKATPEDLGGATPATPAADEQLGYQHPEYPENNQHPEHPENR
ncbi:MAG: preprotein translocase subunit YajC [Corynebacterium sp.]|uniref:preprotein translocase subunit YajC n=1 Tax=Corynebacterium sp. TaxID=1720 RepID=UPI0026E05C23|nr:preprotein translocase subunit YajC [Corynebacterium sp.]MDO5670636.1 preprotein translocase subunit YajC [Corynebacterium sp.]